VIQNLFNQHIKINHRNKNRRGDIIKWMKQLHLQVSANKGEDKSGIPEKINNLSQVLGQRTGPNEHILAYTDRSTETKKKSKNSGYGIHITTASHAPIFSGGGAVRSDGNNFIAEMAAASIVRYRRNVEPRFTLTPWQQSRR
jgi:hypothetical protein